MWSAMYANSPGLILSGQSNPMSRAKITIPYLCVKDLKVMTPGDETEPCGYIFCLDGDG